MKILIIEDDSGLGRGISFALEQEGYETAAVKTIAEGKRLLEKEMPDAVLLDLNLPDGDGIDFCRELRERSDLPVLMLTARDMEVDEIMGLKSGADDYITKPFSLSVLKVRLEKILQRKKQTEAEGQILSSGDIRMDLQKLKVFQGGKELELSMTEFKLLQYFLENKNCVLLREQIFQRIWDEGGNFVEENTLSVNISRLRRKIGGNCIRTIQGMGYLWEEKQ